VEESINKGCDAERIRETRFLSIATAHSARAEAEHDALEQGVLSIDKQTDS